MLRTFLLSLRDSGRVKLPPPGGLDASRIADAAGVLRDMDHAARALAPGEPPAWDNDTAAWAAVTLFRACQAFVHRELDPPQVEALLAEPPPAAEPASAAWSADLTLRWLPDLVGLAAGIASDDPLVARLHALGRAWPLSSVGIRALAGVVPGVVAGHPCLRRLYVDRILERRDLGRLADPRVAEEARAVLGEHPELCPEAARVLSAAGGSRSPGTPIG
ncbi:MAG: hypothetical protein HUU15_17240 [Candidatus Brocadiae bacterium]|nr:hypothetical protein [Candidatus Brocadiia bacterium]